MTPTQQQTNKMTNSQSKPNSQSKSCHKETAVVEFNLEHRPWIKEQIHALKAHKLTDSQFEKMLELIEKMHDKGWGKEALEIIREVENERRIAGLSYTDVDAESDDETE